MELKISDLFQKRGHSFDWQVRINDQKEVIERIKKINSDITDPKSIALVNIADDLATFAGEGIASIVFIEYSLDKVMDLGVILT